MEAGWLRAAVLAYDRQPHGVLAGVDPVLTRYRTRATVRGSLDCDTPADLTAARAWLRGAAAGRNGEQ